MMRRFFVLPVILAAATTIVARSDAARATADPIENITTDASWILQTQTPEGILANGIDKTWVVPYFANIGARGLANAYALTRDARYSTAAWRWLAWYQAHMDSRGFVTDYVLKNGTWTSTGGYDSTDSYAATFLAATRDAFAATGDTATLLSLASGIRKAAAAIEATMASDGLTTAKPGWGWRYLMDNAEVFEGWTATVPLAATLGDADLLSRARDHLAKMALSAGKYWNATKGGYDWGLTTTGARAVVDWAQLYPSAVAQAYPVFAGMVGGSQAQAALNNVNVSQPLWDSPYDQSIIVDTLGPIMYWPDVARGFARAGLTARAKQAYDRLESVADEHARLWPFHPGIAGSLILLGKDLSFTNAAATIGSTSRTPAVPLSHPTASPLQHDDVVVTTSVSDGDGVPKASMCHREVTAVACVGLTRSGTGTYTTKAGDLPKQCAGAGSSYWIVATDGYSIVTGGASSYVYEGDAVLNTALCKALGT